jgi:hypothetical protein
MSEFCDRVIRNHLILNKQFFWHASCFSFLRRRSPLETLPEKPASQDP